MNCTVATVAAAGKKEIENHDGRREREESGKGKWVGRMTL